MTVDYKKYSLEHLENWIHDALNVEEITPEEIYNIITNCVDEGIEYHKTCLTKHIELLSLLKGQRPVDLGGEHYDGWDPSVPGAVTTATTKKDWVDFWEETFTPQENYNKEQVREFEAKEREYERKRAELDAEYELIKAAGGYEWTPESKHSKYYYDVDRNK